MPEAPPWRQFLPVDKVDAAADAAYWQQLRSRSHQDERSQQRGRSFQIQTDADGRSAVIDAVNAAIHLRRPLLITGEPGSGKTSLAYAIAHELDLGPVLTWPITTRSTLDEALYQYDALARLQDAQLDRLRQERHTQPTSGGDLPSPEMQTADKTLEEGDLGDYIQLGPVGTAFLPSLRPRLLLIDEIDKSDLNLPNELLNLFEEGEFPIRELVRRKRRQAGSKDPDATVTVRTADEEMTAIIQNGKVQCCEFPIVVMTSNGEREFPPAFYRRCLRVKMPKPTAESLNSVVKAHFKTVKTVTEDRWDQTKGELTALIEEFLGGENREERLDRATDQLLNAVHLLVSARQPDPPTREALQNLLFQRLSELDE
jgi:MoxR-like ATPase